MAEKNLTDIPRELREAYQKGNEALRRQNLEYALHYFLQILQREPGFFDCRQALRATQFKKSGGSTSFFKKMIGGASSSPQIAKAQLSMAKDPLEAIQICEQILTNDPSNSAAHKLLAKAAMAADLPRTACLSYEILLKNSPNDYDLSMDYGLALAKTGQVTEAEAVYTKLFRAFPRKNEITEALKDLSARQTLSEGGYDALANGSGSYRDILKDKEEAVSLEQENRAVKTEDVAQRLILEYEERLPREPQNLKLLRSLAELYMQKKDYDKALEYCERIRSSEGGNDPSLDRLMADVQLRRFDHLMSQLDANSPDYAEQLARLKAERAAYQLEECKSRAERYPTDLAIRFELGEICFQIGKISEAIAEFQKAQANPAKRLQAMAYLGQCFAKRGMNDLAARTFQNALKEKTVFDEEKKELLYQLGCVLEKMAKKDEAIEQFKQIYELDIGYKDVAAKIDSYYSGQG